MPYGSKFMNAKLVRSVLLLLGMCCVAWCDEDVFSGPQPSERLVPFKIKGVLGDSGGKALEVASNDDDKPVVILFVHEITRPSIGLVRAVAGYAKKRQKDDLKCSVVFLGKDATALGTRIKRASHAMPKNGQLGISVDGLEGPGAYGLNRNVAITAVVEARTGLSQILHWCNRALQLMLQRLARRSPKCWAMKRDRLWPR